MCNRMVVYELNDDVMINGKSISNTFAFVYSTQTVNNCTKYKNIYESFI